MLRHKNKVESMDDLEHHLYLKHGSGVFGFSGFHGTRTSIIESMRFVVSFSISYGYPVSFSVVISGCVKNILN